MKDSAEIREQLVRHLKGGEAFMPLEEMLKKLPYDKLDKRPKDLPYSFYELFYHIWYTPKDILDYCTLENYKAPEWPKDYWPNTAGPESEKEWEKLTSRYFNERQQLSDLITSAENGILEQVPSNPKHTLLRSLMLVIEHTAYHSGQLLIVLRHLGLHKS